MSKMSLKKLKKNVNQYIRGSTDKKLSQNSEFKCPICRREFIDPRVLQCLHCICMECLRKVDLEQNPVSATVKETHNKHIQGMRMRKLKCPICQFESIIPAEGVQTFLPNYHLQHRMLIDSLNKGEICLLCDLCLDEVSATFRCSRCLLNLCDRCAKSHKREIFFPDHELKKLNKRYDGMGITKIRRQAMCSAHPKEELKIYCSSCNVTTCLKCRSQIHADHICESSTKAAQKFTYKIRESLEKTRQISRQSASIISTLNDISEQIESKYSQVQRDIKNYIECYVEAFENHRKSLLLQAAQIKNEQTERITKRRKEIEKKVQDISRALQFTEELLLDGSDFEVLSFAVHLLNRLDWCINLGNSYLFSPVANYVDTIRFIPDERAGLKKNRAVFGVVTSQTVFPSHCHITPEGIDALQNCEVHKRCDLILVTKDDKNQRLLYGAENIEADLRCQNGTKREVNVLIVDQHDGTYHISFTPDVPGKMFFFVTVRGMQIKGSPFPVRIKIKKFRNKNFQNCIYCSKKANKNISAYGDSDIIQSEKPFAYCHSHCKGRHFCCCGNTLQKSECLCSAHHGLYQLSL